MLTRLRFRGEVVYDSRQWKSNGRSACNSREIEKVEGGVHGWGRAYFTPLQFVRRGIESVQQALTYFNRWDRAHTMMIVRRWLTGAARIRQHPPERVGINQKIAEIEGSTQAPAVAARAFWSPAICSICSFIFCCSSLGVGCATWVATIQV